MTLVTTSDSAGVRTLTLNVPDKLNALSWPLLDDLAAAIADTAACRVQFLILEA